LGSLLSALILSFTVITAMTLGILATYGAVTGILHAFAYQSRQRVRATPVLVPSESHAGD